MTDHPITLTIVGVTGPDFRFTDEETAAILFDDPDAVLDRVCSTFDHRFIRADDTLARITIDPSTHTVSVQLQEAFTLTTPEDPETIATDVQDALTVDGRRPITEQTSTEQTTTDRGSSR